MAKVPTQIFVVNSFAGVAIFCHWLYVTYKTINSLYRLAEDPSNFVKVIEEEEVDDTDAEKTD